MHQVMNNDERVYFSNYKGLRTEIHDFLLAILLYQMTNFYSMSWFLHVVSAHVVDIAISINCTAKQALTQSRIVAGCFALPDGFIKDLNNIVGE